MNTALVYARKQHRCLECKQLIEPKQKYVCDTWADDGLVTSYKYCVKCYAIREYETKESGEACFYFGHAREGVREIVQGNWKHLRAFLKLRIAQLKTGQW